MRRSIWGLVLVVVVLVASAGTVAAQDTANLPVCAPTTLADLFPHLNEPTVEVQADEIPSLEEPPVTLPAEEPSTGEAPADEPAERACRPFVYRIAYPVAGPSIPVASFGADREGHQHGGNDIAAATMTPVVAAAAGRVSWIDDECCSLAIRHNDGWTTWYIHLNNDTYGTDDGLGWGIAPGLEVDSVVDRGDLIGWVGDSGNAEDSQPHLHFELRTPANINVDPAASLGRSRPTNEGFSGPFADDDSSPFGNAISTLASIGLLDSCQADPTSFCPDAPATGALAAAIIERVTDLDITDIRLARIPEGPWQDALINTAGIQRSIEDLSGCALPRFCEEAPITFADFQTMLRILPVLAVPESDTLMTVDEFAAALLAQVEGTDPLANCSERRTGTMTGGQLAEMVARALGMVGPPPCDQIE